VTNETIVEIYRDMARLARATDETIEQSIRDGYVASIRLENLAIEFDEISEAFKQ